MTSSFYCQLGSHSLSITSWTGSSSMKWYGWLWLPSQLMSWLQPHISRSSFVSLMMPSLRYSTTCGTFTSPFQTQTLSFMPTTLNAGFIHSRIILMTLMHSPSSLSNTSSFNAAAGFAPTSVWQVTNPIDWLQNSCGNTTLLDKHKSHVFWLQWGTM